MNKILAPLVLWVLVIAVPATIVLADFLVTAVEYDVTVQENIVVDPGTIEVDLFPNDTVEKILLLTNLAENPVDVDIHISLTPSGQGVHVEAPEAVVVPGLGSLEVSIYISASNDAVPGAYTVTVEVERSGG